jgi:ribonuclease HI
MLLTPVTFRATPDDLANLVLIATRLREAGQTFATKTAAVQFALRIAAEASVPTAAPQAATEPDKAEPADQLKLTIHFDGGAAPNPGEMHAAISVVDGDKQMKQLGHGTNNMAEWRALLWGMTFALEQGATDVELVGDSALVVNQANSAWRIKAPEFLPLKAQFDQLRKSFRSVKVTQIGRAKNLAGQHIEAALKDR